MPARQKSLKNNLLSKLIKSDGSGRRKRVSARHQVKRLDRAFEEFENRSGRRNQFSSFGADPLAPQFHRRSLSQVKSGPDVFADALVPNAAAMTPGGLISPNSLLRCRSVRVPNAFTP